MKRLVFVVLTMFAAASLVMAQPKGNPHSRLQAEKIAYLTAELDLTPEEAQVFWPVYNKAQKAQMENYRASGEKTRELYTALKGENVSEQKVKQLLDAWVKVKKEQKNVMLEYQKDFIKAIGPVKTARLYLAEESFRGKQLQRISGRKPDPKKAEPQHGNHKK